MILYDKKGFKYPAVKCRKPMFSSHRGRTWDGDTKTINDNEIRFMIDTTWGFNYYFCYGQEWYRLPHFCYKVGQGDAVDTKHFFTKSVYLFLKEQRGELK